MEGIKVQKQYGSSNFVRNSILLGIAVGVVLPVLPLFVWSFSHNWWFPSLWPTKYAMRAWDYVTSPASGVINALKNSLIISVAVTVLAVFIGVPAGRAFGLHDFKGKTFLQFVILAPAIVPGLAVTMGIDVLFIKMGLSGTLGGVIFVHLLPTVPYMTIVMTGVFTNYNAAFEEQALSLGADKRRTFLLVTLPSISPGIITGGLFVFLISWSQYILTVLIGGGRVVTLPLLLFSFVQSGDNAVTAALSIIFLLPAILILLVSSKYLSGESGGMGGFGNI